LSKKKVHFIVGPHRSGTTFLQTLLGCMPGVATGVETHFFCRIRPYLLEIEEKNGILSFSDIRIAIEKIMFKDEKKLENVETVEAGWRKNGWGGLFFSLISTTFFSSSNQVSPKYIEKTPGHLNHIEEINNEFPDSKFVVIYRDPRAITTSMFKFVPEMNKKQRMGWLKKELGYVNYCFRAIKDILYSKSGNFFIVKYEELKEKQSKILRDVCDFLEITYTEPEKKVYQEVLKHITLESEIHKSRNRSFQLNNENLLKREKLSLAEILYMELGLNPSIKDFGYQHKIPLFFLPRRVIRYLVYLWNKKIKTWDPFPKAETLLDKYIPWSPDR